MSHMGPKYGGGLEAVLLICLVVAMLIYAGIRSARSADLPPVDCWPWWQCNGSKETNHPNCKCWDSK